MKAILAVTVVTVAVVLQAVVDVMVAVVVDVVACMAAGVVVDVVAGVLAAECLLQCRWFFFFFSSRCEVGAFRARSSRLQSRSFFVPFVKSGLPCPVCEVSAFC